MTLAHRYMSVKDQPRFVRRHGKKAVRASLRRELKKYEPTDPYFSFVNVILHEL